MQYTVRRYVQLFFLVYILVLIFTTAKSEYIVCETMRANEKKGMLFIDPNTKEWKVVNSDAYLIYGTNDGSIYYAVQGNKPGNSVSIMNWRAGEKSAEIEKVELPHLETVWSYSKEAIYYVAMIPPQYAGDYDHFTVMRTDSKTFTPLYETNGANYPQMINSEGKCLINGSLLEPGNDPIKIDKAMGNDYTTDSMRFSSSIWYNNDVLLLWGYRKPSSFLEGLVSTKEIVLLKYNTTTGDISPFISAQGKEIVLGYSDACVKHGMALNMHKDKLACLITHNYGTGKDYSFRSFALDSEIVVIDLSTGLNTSIWRPDDTIWFADSGVLMWQG